ncbi:methyltransferase, FxLD system [Streptomyces kanamyceticus]|uniref:Protein-L-isoaspartate O-methyltransferase n=1 Tax=Streptomyces kanamyceticus TaxID=1967 RepID=A0A5J6GEE5_STRKN|nr:methyltransferase, FxLD system [Streptomyces kanamyceticus]QEU92894.1 methyltransferase, FxLD system [Streptomyces kanamyceticus]
MTNTAAESPAFPAVLRNRLVDHILAAGHATDPRVEEALRTVPRHLFLPDSNVETAYANSTVITKRFEDGKSLSCATQPTVMAMMLDQLAVREGDNVLEAGAGTGYNAALLRLLTGPGGGVVTLDSNAEVAAEARSRLDYTGYGDVIVLTRDGAFGAPEYAPYQRGIFTVGPWDLPPGLLAQFADGARLVVPLRWRGQSRSVAFVRDGDTWRSESIELCGFVPMVGQGGEKTAAVDEAESVTLRWDMDQNIDPDQLHGVLDYPKSVMWTGVTLGPNESWDGVWLRLTATEPGACGIRADQSAFDSGLCTPAKAKVYSPALVRDGSLAYLTTQRVEGAASLWELGAIGHGPDGEHLAERLRANIRTWDTDREARPTISMHSVKAPTAEFSEGLVVMKEHVRLVLALPDSKE